jgi:hypothetical protein
MGPVSEPPVPWLLQSRTFAVADWWTIAILSGLMASERMVGWRWPERLRKVATHQGVGPVGPVEPVEPLVVS